MENIEQPDEDENTSKTCSFFLSGQLDSRDKCNISDNGTQTDKVVRECNAVLFCAKA